jgi:HAE1 family hydrophobic/amphiphilic exporter-1
VKVIEGAIRYPVTTAVGVILLVLFGGIALFRLPVQITPNVEDTVITVQTVWPGASPLEIEREIIVEQEEQLKSLEGLFKMESSSQDSYGSITLTFQVGTDVDGALLRVSNRLEQVPEYPADADKPVIRSTDADASAIGWWVLKPLDAESFTGETWTYFDFLDDFVKPEFERVPGVAGSNIYGGREREMHVIFEPAKLASRQVTLNEVAAALDRENRDYSGGDFDEGKRRYIVRTVGEYESTEDIEGIVVAVRNGVPVYLRDIARAELGYRKAVAQVYNNGIPVLAMNAIKEPGSNSFEVMSGVKEAVDRLNQDLLAQEGLELTNVYDQTEYIVSAIQLVVQSILIGGLFAVVALLVYLRSGTSTLVIAVAIPISIIGAFLGLSFFGRTLNVISLAGMAFAGGMVVDNSIVVLENIYRHRQKGKSRFDAAYDGAREVWGAVLASTLTTIAVFVPVVFIEGEVGQLFGDIALAISCAVALSLVVSITVIPSLSNKILRGSPETSGGGYKQLWGFLGQAKRVNQFVGDLVYRMIGSTPARLAVVLGFTLAAIGLSWLLMPDREYLPQGNQNFLFGFMLPPPGYNLEEVVKIQEQLSRRMTPYAEHEAGSAEAKAQPGGGIREWFFVALTDRAFMGVSANDPMRIRELIPEFFAATAGIPGNIFFIDQASIFQRGILEGRNIDVEITGPELEELIARGGMVFGQVMEKLPGAQAIPRPSLDLGNPELQIKTHRRRAAELGLSNRELGYAVSALVDGAKASEYLHDGKEIDIRLMAEEGYDHSTHLLEQMPIATPDGSLVTLGSVADISLVSGPVQVNHRERQRVITILVTPREEMALETGMKIIDEEIVQPMREAGMFSGGYHVQLSGTADKLVRTFRTVRWDLLLALVITYLLLAALFESFLYPVVIMFSVPLAALGGFLGLALMNLFVFKALDVLTMLGFIILIGTVVNNAILIVHQSLNHMRNESMAPRESIRESVKNRMRPIFMSVTTSVFGMMPLALFPGAGSELYRGLAAVVIGGLLVSTLFTLFLVPALFSLTLDARDAVLARISSLFGSRRTA